MYQKQCLIYFVLIITHTQNHKVMAAQDAKNNSWELNPQ